MSVGPSVMGGRGGRSDGLAISFTVVQLVECPDARDAWGVSLNSAGSGGAYRQASGMEGQQGELWTACATARGSSIASTCFCVHAE
jgi:hypothetical protein